MSVQAPPSLQELAVKSLLRNEALNISDLVHSPKRFFPLLLKEAFTSNHSNCVRAMVAAWPFRCLLLGDLVKTPSMETFQAVLDGLDLLISQKNRPRRWKLQVLDLRNLWSGVVINYGSSQLLTKTQTVEAHAECGVKQPLQLVFNYYFRSNGSMDGRQERFLHWAQQREFLLHLCCQKLQVYPVYNYTFQRLLRFFDLNCIQEMEVIESQELKTLASFAPVLGQMGNLHKLVVHGISKPWREEFAYHRDLEDMWFNTFCSQFPKFHSLQHLYLNCMYFLEQRLHRVLRDLKIPLETLSLSFCELSGSDWHYLSQCPKVFLLKHLSLCGVPLFPEHSQYLQVLLERLKTTLQILELENCVFRSPDLDGLLPVLSHCSRLTLLNIYGACISTPDLKNLLRHTANLNQLTMELYPLPSECYGEWGDVFIERSSTTCTELMDILRAVRQPKTVRFASHLCFYCKSPCFLYDLGTRLCCCSQ